MGIGGSEVPTSTSAQAHAGEVDSLRIDAVCGLHFVQEFQKRAGGPGTIGELWRDDDEGEVGFLVEEHGRAVAFEQGKVISSNAPTVQVEEERPGFARTRIRGRQVKEVAPGGGRLGRFGGKLEGETSAGGDFLLGRLSR